MKLTAHLLPGIDIRPEPSKPVTHLVRSAGKLPFLEGTDFYMSFYMFFTHVFYTSFYTCFLHEFLHVFFMSLSIGHSDELKILPNGPKNYQMVAIYSKWL
jgi:hypothetical protein